jgi:N6-adenosine-specific RNA methylase IME4
MSDPFAGLPLGHFAAILADPPWQFATRSPKGITSRSPEHHYRTMTDDQIMRLPVASLAARDALLFLWITGPKLVKGDHLPIVKAWGFEPTAMAFVWIKTRKGERDVLFFCLDSFHVGAGFTTRKNAEFCVLGRRGRPRRLSRSVDELIIAPRREHSRKPDEVYERIEQYTAGPYLELFARAERPNWTAWGDETTKFSAPNEGPDRATEST